MLRLAPSSNSTRHRWDWMLTGDVGDVEPDLPSHAAVIDAMANAATQMNCDFIRIILLAALRPLNRRRLATMVAIH
jgi:hypothetical protein